VKKHLDPLIPGVTVEESLLLTVKVNGRDLGRILFVHGHQGTLDSDRFGALSRVAVRWIWRPIQRWTGINPNTPSRDWKLRKKQNVALYNWAVQQEGLVLIAGHTHHPVFFERERIVELEGKLLAARNLAAAEEIANLRAELEYARVREARRGFGMERPSYFNTGCCCFADGDVTGLEIVAGEIRLVRWLDDEGRRQSKVLTKMNLEDVFRQVASEGSVLVEA